MKGQVCKILCSSQSYTRLKVEFPITIYYNRRNIGAGFLA